MSAPYGTRVASRVFENTGRAQPHTPRPRHRLKAQSTLQSNDACRLQTARTTEKMLPPCGSQAASLTFEKTGVQVYQHLFRYLHTPYSRLTASLAQFVFSLLDSQTLELYSRTL